MSNDPTPAPINILLSREELLFVLKTLAADFIPGLDPDPLGALTPEQQALVLAVAERALRARELGQRQADGQVTIHQALLTAVGVCAYAQHTLFIYHWPANKYVPQRYFGHIRAEDIVIHTRPEGDLHLFTLVPAKAQLIGQVFDFCQYRATAQPAQSLHLTVPSQTFVDSRELAEAGRSEEAVGTLLNDGVALEAAEAFVATLMAAPRVSIIQTVKQQTPETIEKHDFTLVQNDQQTWLIVPNSVETAETAETLEDGQATPSTLTIKSTTKAEVGALLETWL